MRAGSGDHQNNPSPGVKLTLRTAIRAGMHEKRWVPSLEETPAPVKPIGFEHTPDCSARAQQESWLAQPRERAPCAAALVGKKVFRTDRGVLRVVSLLGLPDQTLA